MLFCWLTCERENARDAPLRYTMTWATSAACPVKHDPAESCPITYLPSWASLALRPRPLWFDDAKFGIFLHWGLYSVPAFKSEWYVKNLNGGQWGSTHADPVPEFVAFHDRVYGCSGANGSNCSGSPVFKFEDFVPMFKAELFSPDEWAALFKTAGAKCVHGCATARAQSAS